MYATRGAANKGDPATVEWITRFSLLPSAEACPGRFDR
jgi:hypothetical protein